MPIRTLATILALVFLSMPLQAGNRLPVGEFQVINSAGFVQEDGNREPLATDRGVGAARISRDADSLIVEINGSAIRLFVLENGLASLEWDAEDTALLHSRDIQAFNRGKAPDEIPAWGAELIWPGSGSVQMVLLPLGTSAYTGFLISHPQDRTVVRQMEFRQVFGPANRPQLSASSGDTAK